MILRIIHFLMSICRLKANAFTSVHVVILLFVFCADYSIAQADQLPERTPSINITTEEKAWLKEHPEITIAHTYDWPPYSFLNSNSQPVGPSIDFFEIVAEMVGLKFKVYQDGLWNQIYEAGKNKQVDVVASMTITKEREQWFSFPRPYLFLSSYIITRKDYQEIKHRDDLKGKNLSGAKGTWQNDDVLKNYPSVAIDFVDTYREALLEVSAGKADATVVTLGSALYEIAEKGIYNLQVAAIYEKDTDLITFGVRKDWPELVSIIDKALAAIPEATKIKILNKWMPPLDNRASSKAHLTEEEHAWITEKHSVRVRVPIFPPYFMWKEDGSPEGIAIDYLNLISERTGLKLNYYTSDNTFAEALDGLKNHQGPDLFAAITPTPERRRDILFSKEYLKSPNVIFTHIHETHIITAIDDLFSKKIALLKGTALHEKVKTDYPNINLLLYDSDFEAIEAVATKKADAYIGDLAVASYFILKKGLYNIKVAAPSPFGDQLFSIGSRSDWPEMAGIITKGLASITPEEQQEIRNKYFSIHYEQGFSWGDIFKWGGAVGGIVFFTMSGFVYWNRKLKVEIIERKQAEEKLTKTTDELNERLKELSCLYRISELIDNEKITTEEILQGIADLIPSSWYYSEITCGQITIGHESYKSDGFKETEWLQSQEIKVLGVTTGEVKVFLCEKKPEIDEGPFLKEERALINVIAKRIGDVVERQKAEDEKNKLESRLQQAQKMEAIGTLAGGIAHDFNNILSSIIGFTELALEEAPKGSTQRDDLEEVYIAGNRAKELVQQILAFARQSEEKTKPVRLSDIVTEALKLLRPSTPTSIEIKPKIESTAKVMGNTSQLHQIIMNLCTNAIHSLQKSGGVLEIDLRNSILAGDSGLENSELPAGEYIELNISDNGPGIDSAIIDNIFEPYFTTKGVGEGTGMGLAMVKGLVENYGGDIHVKSEQGEMTSFVIRLPVATGRTSEAIRQVDQVALGTERILFVDDEPPIARMGSRMLESLGYNVTTRTSSFEAFELFKEKPDAFDLLITDMTMPSMSGDVLSLEIRKIRDDIPVILCTGYSNTINDERAKQIGIDAFVYKPFTKPDLARTIRSVLDAC